MGSTGGIEVELKFCTDDATRVRQAVAELGGMRHDELRQVDTYYGHPTRNFAETDEALRVRLVGETGCVTYKGPKLDATTKSREETELWFAGGASDANRFGTVLERLGFHPVRLVSKRREPWRVAWMGHEIEVALDQVDGLGSFVELETSASPETFEAAKAALLDLAKRLELAIDERRSYLSLLLECDAIQET